MNARLTELLEYHRARLEHARAEYGRRAQLATAVRQDPEEFCAHERKVLDVHEGRYRALMELAATAV